MSSTMKSVPNNVKFPEAEEEIQAYWKEIDAFHTQLKKSEGRPEFVFYDGPPFATGLPHYGHILAGSIKDIITRYQTMLGKYVPRKFGWDCHGLPVEFEIDKKLGINGRDDVLNLSPETNKLLLEDTVKSGKTGVAAYNHECRSTVMKYSKEWEIIMTRLGRWIDFQDDYKTMNMSFMESVWWVFKELHKKKKIYQGYKVMPYSTACNTPLSNFEAGQNYKDVNDPEVVVSFPLVDEPGTCMVAWTTTPWTLPSNLAVCVHPKFEYHLLQEKARLRGNDKGDKYWILKERVEAFSKWTKKKYTIVTKSVGKELEGKVYEPLFKYFYEAKKDTCWRVLSDEYVTSDAGTGTVHQVVCPVDANGRFTEEVTEFKGLHIKEADKGIVALLKSQGRVLFSGTLKHSYPFCWRSETPLIYRVVPSFFVDVESIKDRLIANNESPHWVPGFVKEKRFHNWLTDARDWCISRNRYWGCPLPLWISEDGKEEICVGSVAELEELSGMTGLTDIHKDIVDKITITSPTTGKVLRRVEEVFDCWFESGSMPYASMHYPFENKEFFENHFPADFIAEGLDQTRGWFYTLMVLSTCLFDKPAFKNNIVNGLVLAGDGKKMSKRLKNYDDPMGVVNLHSADALRLYLINSPVVRAEPLCFKTEGVKSVVKDVFLPWYNAYRFVVQSVEAYEGANGAIKCVSIPENFSKLNVMDHWLQAASQSLIKFVRQEVDGYRLYTVIPRLLSFIEDLTNWYIKLNRNRLKGDDGVDVQLLAISNVADVLTNVAIVMAPFTPHVSELMYQNLRLLESEEAREDSVHFKLIPQANADIIDEAIEKAMGAMQSVIVEGRKIRDRRTIGLKTPLKLITVVHREQSFLDSLKPLEEYITKELNVEQVNYTTDEVSYVSFKAEANRKALGPRLGKNAKAAATLVAAMTHEEMLHYKTVKDSGGITLGEFTFSGDDIGIVCKVKEGLAASQEMSIDEKTNTAVIMECTIDESQAESAMARDFGSKVQKLRKSSNLREQDVIEVFYSTSDSKLQKALLSQVENLNKTLKVPTIAPLEQMPALAVPVGEEETSNTKIVLTRVAGVVDTAALEKKYTKRIADAVESFVASMDYSMLTAYLNENGTMGVSLKEINYPDEVWPEGAQADIMLELGKTVFLTTGARLAGAGAPKAAAAAPKEEKKPAAKKAEKPAAKKEEKKADPAAEGKQSKKDKKKKGGEAAAEKTPEELAKIAKKKLAAVEKEGGKRGVEIEGACDMGGLAFFCTQLDEPDGNMEYLEKGFAAMNAECDPSEEERKGGAGKVGKVVFSAGGGDTPELLMVCNVPEDKLTNTASTMEGVPEMIGVNAIKWLEHVLAAFAKTHPNAKVDPSSTATYAKAALPGIKDLAMFPIKMKDDAMAAAYGYLNINKCMPPDESDDEVIYHFEADDGY